MSSYAYYVLSQFVVIRNRIYFYKIMNGLLSLQKFKIQSFDF